MSHKDDGGPAFPTPEVLYSTPTASTLYGGTYTTTTTKSSGLSIRDWFAGQALAGLMANRRALDGDERLVATQAYDLADAMLAARKEPRNG